MKGRIIVIDMPEDRASQAALLVDGRLEDLLLDPPKGDRIPAPGEIYWAKVERLVPKLNAAFVSLAPEQAGFLRDARGLKEGAGVLAQVTAYAEPEKATPVTARVLYKGPRVIHTPGAPGINVSRQIKDSTERARLVRAVQSWKPSPINREPAFSEYAIMHRDGGFVLRTAAEGTSEQELHEEIRWLLAKRSERRGATRSSEPGSTAGASLAVNLALREWSAEVPAEILLSESAAKYVLHPSEIERRASADLDRVMRVDPDPDPFDHYGIWDEIERLKSPRVDLPSAAWMAIEATRAMVTVDVNTGAEFSGGAALTANLEAAKELPRQLRLRGHGGQIIIDFAPLPKKDRKRIEEALTAAFRRDPIDTTLAGWTPLGHFELLRKRERRPLSELLG
ncbi:MAG: ribonuclease G [Xanthomonadales bacterium]|nr:ribonuclease G [Xanthomonadales bacterium]